MSARTVRLTPVDAWFFRDGRPYNQGESGQTDARSLFPPFAPTVVGVVRSSLALKQGWNGGGRWSESLHEVLGDGFDDLGQLQFSGPFLCQNERLLFPIPQHLLGTMADVESRQAGSTWTPKTFLCPAVNSTLCDLGNVRLPEPLLPALDGKPFKEPTGLWISVVGYNAILNGRLPKPEAIVRSVDLWSTEPRVGLARNHETRMAEEGKLYSPQYVRLRRDVSLALAVQGVPDDWGFPSLTTFGGEGRMAYCDSHSVEMPLPTVPVESIRRSLDLQTKEVKFTVTLLTPLPLPTDPSGSQKHPLPGDEVSGLPGSHIIAACVGKPVQIGGWNSLLREPLPLRAYLPAGSTWFCQARREEIDGIFDKHGTYIGNRTQYGLGQIALGAWPQHNGDHS